MAWKIPTYAYIEGFGGSRASYSSRWHPCPRVPCLGSMVVEAELSNKGDAKCDLCGRTANPPKDHMEPAKEYRQHLVKVPPLSKATHSLRDEAIASDFYQMSAVEVGHKYGVAENTVHRIIRKSKKKKEV